MFVPLKFIPGISGVLNEEEIERCMEHHELTERLRRTLYYAKVPTTDRPSLPVTEIAVEFFQEAAPRELGSVDTFIASSYGRRACMSPCAMMMGMMYIERLKKRNPEYLSNVSSSDLFLISMMVASKYLYDEGVDEEVFNDEWAESANMDLEQLNELERTFLAAIDWNLFVQPGDFWRMLREVERRIAWKKSDEHGFSSYSDLMVLSENPAIFRIFLEIMLDISKVMAVCSVAYMAGVFTMVASTASVMHLRQQMPPAQKLCHLLPSWELDPLLHSYSVQWFQTELLLGEPLAVDSGKFLKGEAVKSQNLNLSITGNSTRQLGDIISYNNVSSSDDTVINDISRRKSAGNHRNTDNKRQHKPGLHFSGLLTLVMIKDTVLHFISSLQKCSLSESKHTPSNSYSPAKEYTPDEENRDPDPSALKVEDSLVCTCGCCDVASDYKAHCYNLTTTSDKSNKWNSQRIIATEQHNRDKTRRLNLARREDRGSGNVDCNINSGCQCCCTSSITLNGPLPDTHLMDKSISGARLMNLLLVSLLDMPLLLLPQDKGLMGVSCKTAVNKLLSC